MSDRQSKADIDSYGMGIYGSTQLDQMYLKLGATYGRHKVDSRRNLSVLNEKLKTDYDARTFQAFSEIGRQYRFEQNTLEPYIGLSWVQIRNERVREKGGNAALYASARNDDKLLSEVGVRGTHHSYDNVQLEWDLNWQHLYSDKNPDLRLAFSNGTPFNIDGAPLNRDALGVNLGAAVSLAPGTILRAGYEGAFGTEGHSHGGYLRLSHQF